MYAVNLIIRQNSLRYIEICAVKTKNTNSPGIKYRSFMYGDIFVFKASKKSIAGWMAVRVCITKA